MYHDPHDSGPYFTLGRLASTVVALGVLFVALEASEGPWRAVRAGLIATSAGLVLGSPFLVVRWLDYRRHRTLVSRLRGGLCVHCGYDVRASKSVCPECGKSVVG